MAQYFTVPEEYSGKTINQLGGMGVFGGRGDLLAQALGINTTTPLQAGKTYQYYYEGGQPSGFRPVEPGSLHEQFLQKYAGISPEEQQAKTFQEEQRARLGEYTGRLQQVPTELEAVRQAMGIPQAFETYGAAGQEARDIASRVSGVTPTQEAIAKQVGISAPRLQQRIAAKTAELAPGIESATAGLEAAGSGLENLLTEFSSRTQAAFAPYEIEANLLSASSAQEFDLFKTQMSNELSRELAQLSRQTTLDLNSLERAKQLAELEAKYEPISFQNLGTTLGIFQGANLVGSQPITKFGSTSTDTGW